MFNNPNNPTDFPRVVTWYQSNDPATVGNVLANQTINCPSEEWMQQAFTTINNQYQHMVSVVNTMASNMAYHHYPYPPPPMNFPNPNFLNPPFIFPNTNTNLFSNPSIHPVYHKPHSRAPAAAPIANAHATASVSTPPAAVPVATAPVSTPALADAPVSTPPTAATVSTPPAPLNTLPTTAAPVKSQPTFHPIAAEDAPAHEAEPKKEAAAVEEPATLKQETATENAIGEEEVAKEPPKIAAVLDQSAPNFPLTAAEEDAPVSEAKHEKQAVEEAAVVEETTAAPVQWEPTYPLSVKPKSSPKVAPTKAKPKAKAYSAKTTLASASKPAVEEKNSAEVVGRGRYLVNYGCKFGYKPGICDLGIKGYLQLFNHRVFTSEKIMQAGPILPSETMSLEDKTP